MERRDFLRAGIAAGAAAAASLSGVAVRAREGGIQEGEAPFELLYAPHFGMFAHHAGDDPVEQIRFMHREGFRALEDNGMRGRPVAEQEAIGAELARLGMTMGVFVAHSRLFGGCWFASGDVAERERFVAEIEDSVAIAKRIGATWMTVVPGEADPRLDADYQTANVVQTLRAGARVLEPHGLVMVLEPLNTRRDHPRSFLTHVAQAYAICKAVDSKACKILYDVYHQQVTEGNLLGNVDAAWDEIAYFQVGDHPGRNEPGTGEIHYRNVFRRLKEKGWKGVVGMEHGNSRGGQEGERAVIDAYRWADG